MDGTRRARHLISCQMASSDSRGRVSDRRGEEDTLTRRLDWLCSSACLSSERAHRCTRWHASSSSSVVLPITVTTFFHRDCTRWHALWAEKVAQWSREPAGSRAPTPSQGTAPATTTERELGERPFQATFRPAPSICGPKRIASLTASMVHCLGLPYIAFSCHCQTNQPMDPHLGSHQDWNASYFDYLLCQQQYLLFRVNPHSRTPFLAPIEKTIVMPSYV